MGCAASKSPPSAQRPDRGGPPARQLIAAIDVAHDTHTAIAAELARVKALPAEEQSLLGNKYTDPEELWRALEAGGGDATTILRASWFKKQRGGRLPKRGEALPPEAIITVDELRAIAKASECEYGALPVISLSHFWRTKEHPDPDGETMELVITALEQRWKEFEARGVTDLGIIIDWSALWQAPRTPEQSIVFGVGLKGINLWYAHQGTTVWFVTAGADRVKGLTYWEKGWTSFEFALAMLIKPANSSLQKDWSQVVDLGKDGDAQTDFPRPALSEPLAFFGGHAYGDKTYTNGADRDAIVAPKFRETMFQVMGGVKELNFNNLKWGGAEIKALAVVLPLCGHLTTLQLQGNSFGDDGMIALAGAMGALAQCTYIDLDDNQIGDAGLTALASACASALAQCTYLSLYQNQVGDQGMIALSESLGKGALPSLEMLALNLNQIGDAGITAFSSALGSGALASLETLSLEDNQISDVGLSALAEAVGKGALPKCTYINLAGNQIGDAGTTALASALGSGALDKLTFLSLQDNKVGDQGLVNFSEALGKGALDKIQSIYLYGNPGNSAPVDNALKERET